MDVGDPLELRATSHEDASLVMRECAASDITVAVSSPPAIFLSKYLVLTNVDP